MSIASVRIKMEGKEMKNYKKIKSRYSDRKNALLAFNVEKKQR